MLCEFLAAVAWPTTAASAGSSVNCEYSMLSHIWIVQSGIMRKGICIYNIKEKHNNVMMLNGKNSLA